MKLSSSSQLEKITRKTAGLLGLKKATQATILYNIFLYFFGFLFRDFLFIDYFYFLFLRFFLSSLSILNEQVAEILE